MKIKISDIKLDDKNFNAGSEYGGALIKKSFEKFGAGRSILIDKNNKIIAGNKSTENYGAGGGEDVIIVESDGTKLIAVKRTDIDLDTPEGREMALADNATAKANIVWAEDVIAETVGVETAESWGIEFKEQEIPEAQEDDFDATPPEEPITVLGDLYEIGEHRLLCGDSTCSDTVAKLMNGEKADMVFTSPPYNANMNMISYEKGKVKSTPFYENNETDNKTSKEFIDFLSSVLNNCILNTDGWIFWNIGYNANSRSEWIENTYQFKDYLQETIIWKKSTAMPVKYGFTRIIEFIFLYTTKGNKIHINKESETIQNYWEVSNNNSSIENHKACFPIELVRKALNINSENKLILEPFCGSGSTMVASHQLKRKCYGMELDCKYVDVIVKRMIKLDSTLEIKRNGMKLSKKELQKFTENTNGEG